MKHQRGIVRPLWMAVGVFTCVIFGSTLNRCLSCAAPQLAIQVPIIQGALLDTPVEEPVVAVEGEPLLPATKDVAALADPFVKIEEPVATQDGKYLDLTFDKLASFVYEFPDPDSIEERANPIPDSIMALSGKDVAIRGFMIPVKVEGEDVVEFLLVRNQFACCFGVVPKMNEWLHVTMKEGHVAPYAVDIPITVFGKLECGELVEKGIVMSLYRLEATQVTEPAVFK